MSGAAHLDDARLFAIAAGEVSTRDEQAHVGACEVCQRDVRAFAIVRATQSPAVSVFATARAERNLLQAIAGEHVAQRRAWRPAAVVGAVVLAAVAGAAGASLVTPRGARAPESAHVLPRSGAGHAPSAGLDAPSLDGRLVRAPAALSAPVAPRPPAPALVPLLRRQPVVAAAPAPVARAEAPPVPVLEVPGLADVRRLVNALAQGAPVEAELAAVLARYPATLPLVDEELRAVGSAFALRARCERGLLTTRDRAAVDACQLFARRFPDDPAVRTLAFAAGRVAEDELGDLALAEAEYDRAILLSPFAGVSASDALFARARVRQQQGEVDEARADLRLYLATEPAARHDPAVVALARALEILGPSDGR